MWTKNACGQTVGGTGVYDSALDGARAKSVTSDQKQELLPTHVMNGPAKSDADGRRLEAFVAFVEAILVPKGFEVTLNRKEYDESGNPLAEFDIEIRGKVGTGEIAWLIECRDRPSDGAAPGSWIEQLIGRRDRFRFNKVTAVSTTGFSASGMQAAERGGIELREVSSIDPKEFGWLAFEHMIVNERIHNLRHAQINVVKDSCPEALAEIPDILKANNAETPMLLNSTGAQLTVIQAFYSATARVEGLWDSMVPNGQPVPINLLVQYLAQDRFLIATGRGTLEVETIQFQGEVFIRQTLVAPNTFEYTADGKLISETARFPVTLNNQPMSIEIHKIADAEFIQVVARPNTKGKLWES